MEKYKVKITDIKEEAPGIKTFLLEKPKDFTWEEGAHAHVGLMGFDEGDKPNKALVHHLSIMSLPQENKIGFTTKVQKPLSVFKEGLSKLKVGDELTVFKIGCRMNLRREDRPVVLVSMGVGIATMRPLIYAFLQNGEHVSKIDNININSSGQYIYKGELEKLENDVFHNDWIDSRVKLYDTLAKECENSDSIFYVVGSDGFLKDVLKYLQEKGVKESSIMIDKKEEQKPEFFSETI